ncbi:MAG: peptidylprolyl isomerase [Elusimicrobiota bacterium]
MNKNILVVLLFITLFSSGCSRKDDVVAYVGSREITSETVKKRLKDLPDYYYGFISSEGGKRQYLSGIIKETVLLEKAYDLNIHKRKEVRERIQDLKREIILTAAVDYIKNNEIQVSDHEIRDYYEKNKEKYTDVEEVKISHILLNDENKAREILAKIRNGASFSSMARQHSVDTVTAINDGDLGYFKRGELANPQFEEAVFQLENVGEVSDVIKTSFGYHIAKLTGRRSGKEKSFEDAKEEIASELEQQKFIQLVEDYKNDYNVRINYDVLDKINLRGEKTNNNQGERDDEN